MNFKKCSIAMLLGVASLASQAIPVTYTMTVDNVSGTANSVAVGPGATTVIVVNADTTGVAPAGPVNCVQGTSGTISITGINAGAAQALTGNYFVCASTTGTLVGIDSVSGVSTLHRGNLTGSPAVDLISNLGPVTYDAGSIHSHGGSLSLAAGGTYSATRPEPGFVSNTTASTFQVALTAPPAPVPTLSEWAMITFAMLIAGFGIYQQRRRQL